MAETRNCNGLSFLLLSLSLFLHKFPFREERRRRNLVLSFSVFHSSHCSRASSFTDVKCFLMAAEKERVLALLSRHRKSFLRRISHVVWLLLSLSIFFVISNLAYQSFRAAKIFSWKDRDVVGRKLPSSTATTPFTFHEEIKSEFKTPPH